MGTFKGTKGEWQVKDGSRYVGTNVDNPIEASTICQVFGTGEEAEANAKLISCAPELLLALEMAVMVMPNGHTRTECLETIKKATE